MFNDQNQQPADTTMSVVTVIGASYEAQSFPNAKVDIEHFNGLNYVLVREEQSNRLLGAFNEFTYFRVDQEFDIKQVHIDQLKAKMMQMAEQFDEQITALNENIDDLTKAIAVKSASVESLQKQIRAQRGLKEREWANEAVEAAPSPVAMMPTDSGEYVPLKEEQVYDEAPSPSFEQDEMPCQDFSTKPKDDPKRPKK